MILIERLREKETRRAVFHLFFALGIIFLALVLGKTIAPLLFSVVVILGFCVALLAKRYCIPIITQLLCWFDRDHEQLPGKGAFFYLLSATLCLLIFPQKIAFAAILFLGVADGTASLVGRNSKLQYRHSNKTIEGSVAGACAGIAVTGFFLLPMLVSIIAAIVTMVVESFDYPPYLDDNLLTPLIFGGIAQYIGFAFIQ